MKGDILNRMPKAKKRKLIAARNTAKSNGYSKVYFTVNVDQNMVFYRSNQSFRVSEDLFAIFKALIEDEKYKNLKHVWAVGDIKKAKQQLFSKYAECPDVSFVKYGSKKYLEWMASAGVLFFEKQMPRFFVKKKEQKCINIWPETPIEHMGVFETTRQPVQIWNAQRSFYSSDILTVPNHKAACVLMDAYNLDGTFDGTVLETACPSMELLSVRKKPEAVDCLEKALQISLKNKKIILYAPRARRENGRPVDSSRVMKSNLDKMNKEFPDDICILTRLEQEDYEIARKKKPAFLMVPDYIPDYMLLNAADLLITDYNPLFFRFAELNKPVVFFDFYKVWEQASEDFYMTEQELPGQVCHSAKQAAGLAKEYLEKPDYAPREAGKLPEGHGPVKPLLDLVFGSKEFRTGELKSDKPRILIHIGTFGRISDRELCLFILRNIDYDKYTAVVDGNDIYAYQNEFSRIHGSIKIVNSRFENNKSHHDKSILKKYENITKEQELFEWEFKSMYGGLTFDIIIDTVGKATTWMNVFAAVSCSHKALVLNQGAGTGELLTQFAGYVDEVLIVDGTSELTNIDKKITCMTKGEFIKSCGLNPLNVLFISAFDSTNYVFVNLIKELKKRGHACTVVVKDKDDAINNKMYIQENIDFIEIDEFDLKLVDVADFVFSAPLKYDCYNSLYKRINSNNKFIITFASLFSSIVMGVNPDLSLSLGKSKFDEFKENGLKYNLVAVGNPQYDHLIRLRRELPEKKTENIKNVLVMEQGAYPFGAEGKGILAGLLCHIAGNNPQMTFTVKPRYIPSEKGSQLHVLSEHLYDFIENKPDNLILLDKPVVLEDIMHKFDAAVTTWSTAYLDAAVLGLPLILIEGLPSTDVYNVRSQRIEAAYNRLRKSGCVVPYKELYEDGPLPFRKVDEAYLSEELYAPLEPCVPRIMELLEFLYRKLIVTDKRWKNLNQLEYQEFFDRFDELPLVEVGSSEFRQRKRLLNETNRILQKFIFENRCMAQVMDIGPVYRAWDYEVSEETIPDEISAAIRTLKQSTEEIRDAFFRDNFDQVCRDRILQDYYFQWLFTGKKYHELLAYDRELICPESLYFYRAVILYRRHRYKEGTRYMSRFFEISASKETKDLRKDMSLSGYLWKGRLGKYLILHYLDRYKAYEVMESIDTQGVIYQRDIMLYYRVKSLIGRELSEEAAKLCKDYGKNLLRKPKSKNLKANIKYYVGRFFFKKTEKLTQNAAKRRSSQP